MELLINGKPGPEFLDEADDITQAVVVSLFSWRRSEPDDGVPIPNRQGWWGDTFAENPGDKIGSRLWLLQREKLTDEVLRRAEHYARESLLWLVEDGFLKSITVTAERQGTQLNLLITCVKTENGQETHLSVVDFWR